LGPGFAASYTYLETEITRDQFGREGQRLLRRPAHSASATLSYATGGGSLAATLHRVGSRHDVGYVLLPWYTTLDFAGEVQLLRRADVGLVLTARLENAFDYEYETIANYAAPGRTFLVGGRVRLESGSGAKGQGPRD
jgi:vitamin B12 transporter